MGGGGGGDFTPAFPGGGGGGVLTPDGGGGGGVFPPGTGFGGGADFPAVGGGGVFPAGLGVGVEAFVAAGFGALFDYVAFPAAGLAAVFGALFDYAVFAPPLAWVVWAVWVVAGCGVSFFLTIFPKSITVYYGKISETIPAAIVFPPSLKANLAPLEIVIGKLSFIWTLTLSPGIAIFIPSGNFNYAAVSDVL